MTKASQLIDLQITPGVMPSTDGTNYDIPCWSFCDKIRFDPSTGRPRKIGGWRSNLFDYDAYISGVTRTVYSAIINQKTYTVLGTNSYLYSLIGSNLTNITPLKVDSVAAANSLDSHYDTLANNPITTTLGETLVVISDADASNYQVGDRYTISGASTVNGVPNTELNFTHVVRAVGVGQITVRVITAATSSGSGGGAAVVRKSGLITLNSTAHGLADGERVFIDDAATFAGIADTDINLEFIVRNTTADTFDFMTEGTSSSAVSGGGGASTIYYGQIEPGNINQGQAQGYGAGLYGIGLYGTMLVSSSGATYPQIWFVDRFGENIIMTPGNQGKLYAWTGANSTAPAVITNAPDGINYAFVSDNIVVTFGYDQENKIKTSDIGDYTNWTASSTNQVFEDNIEGASRLISHCPVDGYNLVFTEQQTFTFRYIGLPLIWEIDLLDANIGIIAPMARVSVNGIPYWMGQDNFYMFRGGKVETIPSNFGAQSSIVRYVFDNLNYSQRFKAFAWYNEKYDEVWFHYPSSQSNECDRVARLSRKILAWAPDTMDRTAGEWPTISLSNPRLANVDALYTHESGNDADGVPMPWEITSKKFSTGTNTGLNVNIIPDNTVTGTVTGVLSMYNYPQSATAMTNTEFSLTQTTEKFSTTANGRFWKISIAGNELDQSYLMGQWQVDQQGAGRAP